MAQRALVAPMGPLWTVKADARQQITAHESRAEAIETARSLLMTTGGGVLIVRDAAGGVDFREPITRPTR